MRASAEAQILAGMPSQARSEYRRLWTDLKIGRSREARLVKNLDRLEMAFQAREYEARGAGREKLAEFYRSALREMTDASLRRVVRGLMLSR